MQRLTYGFSLERCTDSSYDVADMDKPLTSPPRRSGSGHGPQAHSRDGKVGKCIVSDQHVAFLETFGFIVFRSLFSRREIVRINNEFERAMPTTRYTAQTEGTPKRSSRFFMDQDTPFMASLAGDSRFGDAAQQLLQRPVLCIHVAGAYYSGNTGWHSDNFELAYSGVKFVAYLEELHAGNGALRLIPGSHRNPMWQRSKLTGDTAAVFGVQPEDIPAFVFESKPGDVLAFQHSLWHASFNGGSSRRMLEINYYADPKTDREKKAFRQQMRWNHQPSAELGIQMYPRYWRSMENQQRSIARLNVLGTLETPIVRHRQPV